MEGKGNVEQGQSKRDRHKDRKTYRQRDRQTDLKLIGSNSGSLRGRGASIPGVKGQRVKSPERECGQEK